MEQKKRGPGMPRVVEGEDTSTFTLRLSKSQRAKVDRQGGGRWVRSLIDAAPEEQKPALTVKKPR